MADYSTTYAVGNSAEVSVVCHIQGAKRILVQENYNSTTPPTADLLQRGAAAGSTQVNIAKGTPAIFTAPADGPSPIGGFNTGDIVGTIQTVSGSITAQQIEYNRI